jgi:hypothetical protein
VKYIHAVLKTFTASEQSPAMPARAKPMNPTGKANEDLARKPPKKEEAGAESAVNGQAPQTHVE